MQFLGETFSLIGKQPDDDTDGILSDLDILRLKVVFILNILFIILLLPLAILEFRSGNLISSGTTAVSLITLIISTYLILKNHLKYPIFLTVTVLPILGFLIAFFASVAYEALFAQLCLLLAIAIWLLNKPQLRIYYTLIYFAFLSLLYGSNNPISQSIGPMSIIAGYISVIYVSTLFLEKQEKRISAALKNQKIAYHALAKKNQNLLTLSQIMSHDLKAPLRTISSFSELLKRKFKSNTEKEGQYLEYIDSSAQEMGVLIDNLLVFHKVESEMIDFKNVDLNEVIHAVKSTYDYDIYKNGLIIDMDNLPIIQGNFTLIKTLFGNLISNSIKYQPKAKKNHNPHIKIWSYSTMNSHEIYIADNGIGIDEKYIKDLFTPFKRFHLPRDYEGTGLGMSICKSAMEKHHGTIELFETSDKGTTFKLIFPINPTV